MFPPTLSLSLSYLLLCTHTVTLNWLDPSTPRIYNSFILLSPTHTFSFLFSISLSLSHYNTNPELKIAPTFLFLFSSSLLLLFRHPHPFHSSASFLYFHVPPCSSRFAALSYPALSSLASRLLTPPTLYIKPPIPTFPISLFLPLLFADLGISLKMAIPEPPFQDAIYNHSDSNSNSESLIPGLPNEIAELCLLHLPYPYHALARSVSSSWNRAITHPTFLLSKKSLSLSRPYLFVLAFHKSTARMQWQALDPSSGRWFVLPTMPSPKHVCPPAFACASLPRQGKLFVIGGMRSDTHTPMHSTFIYRTSTNQWSQSSPMPTARSFVTAAEINGQIIAVGGSGTHALTDATRDVEMYDPESETWEARAKIEMNMGKYDSAVVGRKLYVTEGWTWPFMFSPRGAVYDGERDRWREMRRGMREGWTGVSAVVRGRVMVISEYGDCPVKVYDEEGDTWEYVGGDRFPREALERPLRVRGEEGRMYVVSSKLNVGIGSVEFEEDKEKGKETVKVKWEVVEAPKAFAELSPSHCQVLYA